MLVGDLVQDIREAMTDRPQTLPDPVAPIVTVVVAVAGATLPAGTYFLNYTWRTPWGETLTGGEAGPFAIALGQGFQITGPPIPPSVTAMRVYFTQSGGVSGSEQQFQDFTALFGVVSASGPSATPPTKSRAWLPDTDGD